MLMCIYSTLSGQEFRPIKFEGYTPIWSHYAMADSLPITTQSYIIEGEPVYKGDDMYLLHNIFDEAPFQGYLVEKLGYKSGRRLWSDWKYYTELNTREYATSPRIEGDRYRMMLIKEARNNSIFGFKFLWSGIIGNRSYDTESGDIVESTLTDSTDVLNKITFLPLDIYASSSRYYTEEDYIKRMRVSAHGMKLTKIDYTGHLIDSTVIDFDNLRVAFSVDNKDLGNGNSLILGFSGDAQPGIDPQKVMFYVVDRNQHTILKEKDITALLPPMEYNILLLGYKEESFVVMSSPDVFDPYRDRTLSHISMSGELLETIKFDVINNSSTWAVMPVKRDKTMLIAYTILQDGYEHLYIYKTDGKGNLNLVKELKVDDDDARLIPYRMWVTPDNNLLIASLHYSQAFVDIMKYPPKWQYYMLFDGRELGIITATEDIPLTAMFSLYPNPATDYIQVISAHQIDEVIFTNPQGIKASGHSMCDNQIDISCLPVGMYIIELKSGGKSLGMQKVIKVL